MTARVPPPLLDATALDEALAGLPGWQARDGRIVRTWRTADWRTAVMLGNALAHLCEVAWHHPEMTLAWGEVRVALWTHESGGITARDIALAAKLDEVTAWTPEPPLEGVPAGTRFAYLRRG